MLIHGLQAITSNAAVTGAIRDAARATGASFDYLLATARAESGLNPKASAKTSSARGLFQFIDRTWLATLKQAGPQLGYGRFADAITQNAQGRFEVADPVMRQKIWALRDDPAANAAMAGAFTRQNANRLAQSLGRQPTDGELYMAHFMGAKGASRLVSLAASNPTASAASSFPKAAAANPSIFFDRAGKARSADEVYAELTNRFDAARTGSVNAVAAVQPPGAVQGVARVAPVAPTSLAAPVTATPVRAAQAAGVPRSLFNDRFNGEPRREPVSQIVRELWTTRPHVAAALTGGVTPAGKALGARAITPAPATEGLRDLYRDLPPNARALFTNRS
jgi:hypothetical protein